MLSGWVLKNWCFWTMVLEKTLESPLDCKEMKPVNLEGNQSWTFIGKIDAEAETPVCWSPDAKNWLTGKDPDAGKDWRQEEKGMTEDEIVGWHHWLDGHEFEQAQGVGDGDVWLFCNPLEKERTTHFSILSWEIPWTEGPSGLQSMGSQRIGHDREWTATTMDYSLPRSSVLGISHARILEWVAISFSRKSFPPRD